jgi:outer membrane protein OmpA-like peptidoglycan-associated protein
MVMRAVVVGALVAGLALPGCARRSGINTTTAAVGDARGAAVVASDPDRQKRDLEQVVAGKGRVVRDGDTLRASLSSDVLFESGSARLQPGADAEIAQIAEILKRQPGAFLEITGHTDNRGTERHNLDLSERRAATIRDGLVRNGVDASRVRTRGEGEQAPIATNDTATGRAANRRIDVTVRPGDGLAREQSGAPSQQPQ